MSEEVIDGNRAGDPVTISVDAQSGVVTAFNFKHRDATLFPATRIKKIMLADSEVGKIKKESPALLALCVEMFIEQLITTAAAATQEDGARLLSAGYLKRVVMENPKWDFIHQLVQKIPDLPEHVEGETPKRTRKKKDTAEEGDEEPKIKKAAAKRASAAPRSRKKKEDDAGVEKNGQSAPSNAMEASVPAMTEDGPSEPVFVSVSLSAAPSQAPAPMATAMDEDDFDA